ncbi:MAG: NAD-dependent epimerase/dehydratase [Microbacteriaceae bacterium]|nr:NAD-dependent epimerase/dehydratase [Microbacteriaceae bacterium]
MRIAVTGSAGFVGGAVAGALRADGHDVRAYARAEWDIAVGPIAGDADAVVHCAALASDRASLADARRANVDGTRNVAASFPGARFVHLSTSSVYDQRVPTVNARGVDGPAPRLASTYARTKAEAEGEVPPGAVILRPHAVYGPGDTTLLPRILAGVRRGRLVLPGGGRALHSLTHIDNLVAAVRLALTGAPGVYNVSDAAPVPLRDAVAELLARRGVDAEIRGIPYPVALALAPALPNLTRYAVGQLGLERTLDITAARDALGYDPTPTDLTGAELW